MLSGSSFGINSSFAGVCLKAYIKESHQPAQACVLWLHGLGANAGDMSHLADQLSLNEMPFRHVFLEAPIRRVTINNGLPMPAWYDIVGTGLTDREDKEGIEQSQAMICAAIETQKKAGFKESQIFLAGFSQGAAMSLSTGLNKTTHLGGIICLSGYLPLVATCQTLLAKNTPIFLAYGLYDSLVLPQWTLQTRTWLEQVGYNTLCVKSYPMEHTVCKAEIDDLSVWLNELVRGIN